MNVNKNIKFKISFSGKNLNRSIDVALSLILLVLIFFEFLTVKNSLALISQANVQPLVLPGVTVRLNFTGYDQVVERIKQAESFQPSAQNVTDPFSAVGKAGQ